MGRITHNTYAPVTEDLAVLLKRTGERVFDRDWLRWHRSVAWQFHYYDAEVCDVVLRTMQDYRNFVAEGRG